MKSSIEVEKKKKQDRILYIIIGASIYFLMFYFWIHYNAVELSKRDNNMVNRITEATTNMLAHPFYFFTRFKFSAVGPFLGFSVLGGSLLFMYVSNAAMKKHDNSETVNGEAHFMTLEEMNEYNIKRSDPIGKPTHDGPNNMILSRDIFLAIDGFKTRRNCNVLVIGGSGAGKSRFFAAPNVLQYNSNFVITDPSGEFLRDYGKALEDNGYRVRVFNLTDVYRGNRYNPFHYIRDEKDVFILVETLIKNTTPPDGKGGDPFWENSEKLLLTALILYLWHNVEESEQTFDKVVELISLAEVDENDPSAESLLDLMFKDMENEDPENLAVRQYKTFKLGAGKTLKSILISVGVRLKSFTLSDIKYLTKVDEFEFEHFADTKQALFVIIPTADTTFNFLVSLMYSQLFSTLYNYVETKAEFGYMAYIDRLNILRVEQATDRKDSERAKIVIEDFIQEVKKGVHIEKSFDKDKDVWNIYLKSAVKSITEYKKIQAKIEKLQKENKPVNPDDLKKANILLNKINEGVIGWRGTKEMAMTYASTFKDVRVEKCSARCPNHVRLILDEFANIGQIPDFNEKLATIRKYEISCSIIVQALTQLKGMYKDNWNTLVANCDTKLFLGCDDSETIEWILKMLGKKTTTVENTSWQANGSGSTSLNKSSLELMTIDQVTMMADDECLVRIRGVRPYYGKKYELTEHPNYKYAKSTSGKFVIPLAADAKIKQNIPLRLRKKQEQEKVKALAAQAEGQTPGIEQKENKNNNNVQKNNSVQKNNKKIKEKPGYMPDDDEITVQKNMFTPNVDENNKNNKESAKKAKEELANFKETDKSSEDFDSMVIDGFGFDAKTVSKMPDEVLKEAIESTIALMPPPKDGFTYGMTN